MRKWKLWIIAVAVITVVAIVIISAVGMESDVIVNQYYALTNRPENSARQFKVPFGYITINHDGTVNIEFASSISTISNDINVDDDSVDVASGEDDRQTPGSVANSDIDKGSVSGSGSGQGSGQGQGGAQPGPNPINGKTLMFPAMGESIWYKEINTGRTGTRRRVGPDETSWEFAWGYITKTSSWPTMTRRANKIAPYVQNAGSNDALKVRMGSEEYYVGCLPISGFGNLGDIVEFTFDNGNSMKVLAIDAKSSNDAAGTGSAGQCNTQYCHGRLTGNDIKLCAVELWCGGSRTSDGNRSSMPKGNVVSAKIVGHWGGFN